MRAALFEPAGDDVTGVLFPGIRGMQPEDPGRGVESGGIGDVAVSELAVNAGDHHPAITIVCAVAHILFSQPAAMDRAEIIHANTNANDSHFIFKIFNTQIGLPSTRARVRQKNLLPPGAARVVLTAIRGRNTAAPK